MGKSYRLHWEGQDAEPEVFATMKEVRKEIARQVRENGLSIKKATEFAYILTEKEYQKSLIY